MFREIPVLPVVVPLAAVVLAVLLWSLRRRDRLSVPRAAVAVALCVYTAGVVANTVFPIFLDKPTADLRWAAFLVPVPFLDYEVGDAVMNVGGFAPLGVLAGLVLARPSWGRVLAVVAAASLAIEVTQYLAAHFLGGGHIADANDLFWNVVGGVLGLALLRLACLIPRFAAFAEQFRWHPLSDAGTVEPGRRPAEVQAGLD